MAVSIRNKHTRVVMRVSKLVAETTVASSKDWEFATKSDWQRYVRTGGIQTSENQTQSFGKGLETQEPRLNRK